MTTPESIEIERIVGDYGEFFSQEIRSVMKQSLRDALTQFRVSVIRECEVAAINSGTPGSKDSVTITRAQYSEF